MPDSSPPNSPGPGQSDWHEAQPSLIPEPTVWPAFLALASTFMLWGLASSLIITAVGLVMFALSLAGWIRDIRHERHQS